jgi:hypothetical protein
LNVSWCPYHPNLIAASTLQGVTVWDTRMIRGGSERQGIFSMAAIHNSRCLGNDTDVDMDEYANTKDKNGNQNQLRFVWTHVAKSSNATRNDSIGITTFEPTATQWCDLMGNVDEVPEVGPAFGHDITALLPRDDGSVLLCCKATFGPADGINERSRKISRDGADELLGMDGMEPDPLNTETSVLSLSAEDPVDMRILSSMSGAQNMEHSSAGSMVGLEDHMTNEILKRGQYHRKSNLNTSITNINMTSSAVVVATRPSRMAEVPGGGHILCESSQRLLDARWIGSNPQTQNVMLLLDESGGLHTVHLGARGIPIPLSNLTIKDIDRNRSNDTGHEQRRQALRPSEPKFSVSGLLRSIDSIVLDRFASTETAMSEPGANANTNSKPQNLSTTASSMGQEKIFWQLLQEEMLLLEDRIQRGMMPGLRLAGADQYARQISLEIVCRLDMNTSAANSKASDNDTYNDSNADVPFKLIASFPHGFPNKVGSEPVFTVRSSREYRTIAVQAEAEIKPALHDAIRNAVARSGFNDIHTSSHNQINQSSTILMDMSRCFRIHMLQLWERRASLFERELRANQSKDQTMNVEGEDEGGVGTKETTENNYTTTTIIDPLAYCIPNPRTSGAVFSPLGELLCFGGAKLAIEDENQGNTDSYRHDDDHKAMRPKTYADFLLMVREREDNEDVVEGDKGKDEDNKKNSKISEMVTYSTAHVRHAQWLAEQYDLGPMPTTRHRRRRAKSVKGWDPVKRSEGAEKAASSSQACRRNAEITLLNEINLAGGNDIDGHHRVTNIPTTRQLIEPGSLGQVSSLSSISQIWKLLAVAFDLLETSRAGELRGAVLGGWEASALGGPLLRRIFAHLRAQGDIQTLSTAICIMGDTVYAAALLTRPPSGGSSTAIIPSMNRLDIVKEKNDMLSVEDLDRTLLAYSDVLARWGLLSKSVEVLNHISSTSAIHGKRGVESAWVNLSVKCRICSSSVACTSSSTSMLSHDANDSVSAVLCGDCKNFPLYCYVCDCSLRGIGCFCSECGHGGHVAHMAMWFEQNSECPACCGCRCAEVQSIQTSTDISNSNSASQAFNGAQADLADLIEFGYTEDKNLDVDFLNESKGEGEKEERPAHPERRGSATRRRESINMDNEDDDSSDWSSSDSGE